MKDVTPTPATKERFRVQAGRGGGPISPISKAVMRQSVDGNFAVADEPAPANFLAVIARAAADPRTDIAKMQALLDMQKQIEEREAEKAYTRDFIALQDVLPVINRDGKIEIRAKDQSGGRTGALQQSTPYSTYPNIMKVCKPLLRAHGFGFNSRVAPAPDGKILVRSKLRHVEHFWEESEFPLPAETSGSKNNVQGWGSSQQYGMRYNAIALLNIISEAPQDQDKNGHAGDFQNAKGGGFAEAPADLPKVSTAQRDDLVRRITAANIKETNFCTKYGVAQVGFLPAELYDAAVTAINNHVDLKRGATGG